MDSQLVKGMSPRTGSGGARRRTDYGVGSAIVALIPAFAGQNETIRFRGMCKLVVRGNE